MIDDDLPARYRNAWREAYAQERAHVALARRRLASIATIIVLAGLALGLSAAFLGAAMQDTARGDLAWAIITGLRK